MNVLEDFYMQVTIKQEKKFKLFKLKPVLDAVRNNCIKIEQECD